MEKIYPYSTKNSSKASFRIADILHQQQQQQPDTQLLAQHLMMAKNEAKNSKHSDLKSSENKGSNNDLPQPSKTPSPSSIPDNSSPEHSTMKSDSGSGGTPMKPTPMYSNFPLPFPLGFHPAFHPAAAYLNYADAIHKGEFYLFIFLIINFKVEENIFFQNNLISN